MAILVTGATGFVGGYLVEALISKGERVRALVRKTSKIDKLKEIDVDLVVGDLRDFESVDLAMKGADIIFHVAAAPDWSPAKYQWSANYLGTLNMLKAASKRKTQRFIHCSTVAVLGFSDRGPLNESSPYAPSPCSPYALSKCEAEKEAIVSSQKGVPISIIRLAQVYGPSSVGTMGLGFKYIQRGFFPLVDGGKALLQPIYVQDVADAMILAMESDKALGQVYNIAGEKILSFKQFFSFIADAFGVKPPQMNLSGKITKTLGYLLEMKSRLFGGSALLTRFRAECLSRNMTYDISKAKTDLGFTPKIGIEEGVNRTVNWYNYVQA